jgi:uncharacterized protein (TIGR02301 family)
MTRLSRSKAGVSSMPRSDACWAIHSAPMFRSMRKACTALSLALCLAAGPASAQFFGYPPAPAPPPQAQPSPQPKPLLRPRTQPQGQTQGPPEAQSPPMPPAQTEPAPYDHDLQRLSEILGALHFLRSICGTNEGQKWRTEAQALIDAEAPTGDRHDQMVASFNRGYRGFQQSYRSCTPAAVVVIRRYLEEGANIARDVTARYAN